MRCRAKQVSRALPVIMGEARNFVLSTRCSDLMSNSKKAVDLWKPTVCLSDPPIVRTMLPDPNPG